jgi:hypothetical protein
MGRREKMCGMSELMVLSETVAKVGGILSQNVAQYVTNI